MVIRGNTNIVKVYDYSYLINLNEYDLSDSKDLERLNDAVVSFLDSGEAEALSLNEELVGVNPDGTEIEIENNVYTAEEVDYDNKNVNNIINENFKVGDVVLLLRANGEGYFEYEVNPKVDELKIGYTACDMEAPDNEFYNNFCDLLLPYSVTVNGEKIEITANNFYPKSEMTAELYVVKEEEGVKFLDKVSELDVMHFGWDLFEDIIQVDYDESK
ncbi:hypothetical protein [Lebetimonas natsushimae]|nr:hypothetical protein [Lebetimonas natsushimae]